LNPRTLFARIALPALLLAAAPAAAQSLGAGMEVKDTEGGTVGTIVRVDGDNVVLRTDRHEVLLPAASFAVNEQGAFFGLTREALNADVDRLQAEAEASVRVGAEVRGRDGTALGSITELDGEFVTIDLGDRLVRLPRSAVGASPDGPVVGTTRAELVAAAQ
jgi:hypothetical protein